MDNYYNNLKEFRRSLINIMRKMEFSELDPAIRHQQLIPNASYSPWLTDNLFLQTYEVIKNHTLVDIYRCYELYSIASGLNKLEGHCMEVGVWKGGTAAIIAKAVSENTATKVLLFDTFKGVPKAGAKDTLYKGGEHSDTSREVVIELMKELKLFNCEIHRGIFPDDFPNITIQKLKMVHIDVDVYQSAKDIFEYVWPKLVVGGVVVFDDYGFWGCEGITKLFNGIMHPNVFKVYNLNGHGLIAKIAS